LAIIQLAVDKGRRKVFRICEPVGFARKF